MKLLKKSSSIIIDIFSKTYEYKNVCYQHKKNIINYILTH